MKKPKNNFAFIAYILFAIIVVFALIGLCSVEIYVWVTYAKTPIEEMPLWALWFMFKG